MPTLYIKLPAGQTLTLTCDVITTGTYARKTDIDYDHGDAPTALAADGVVVLGPYVQDRHYEIISLTGQVDAQLANADFLSESDAVSDEYLEDLVGAMLTGNTETGISVTYQDSDGTIDFVVNQVANAGTVATGSTVVEYGDQYQYTSVITVNTTLPAIAGGADLAVGKLLYTLPAGACVIKQAYMSLAITQTEANITADTPDVGLGTTIGSGANALLSDVGAAAENIITGQTANDCDGTAEVKTIANQVLVVEAAGDHTIYFNAADGWAADGDAAATLTGTVVLHWQFMA